MARKVKTSKSDPIFVKWVDAPEGYTVGITIGPGKKMPAREGFDWDRDVAQDLDKLRADGMDVLVCLLEKQEMADIGVAHLLDAARERGIDALHFPIRDVNVPSKELANRAVAALLERRGKKIVVHCAGGLGRSGVIVGCLLRSLGLSWEETHKRLQAARGRECPQTDAQRDFVEGFVYALA